MFPQGGERCVYGISGQQTSLNGDDVMGMKSMKTDNPCGRQPAVGYAAGKQKQQVRGQDQPEEQSIHGLPGSFVG